MVAPRGRLPRGVHINVAALVAAACSAASVTAASAAITGGRSGRPGVRSHTMNPSDAAILIGVAILALFGLATGLVVWLFGDVEA